MTYSYYGENGYSTSTAESRFFFKPFILYWNIADYNVVVVSRGLLLWLSGKESACL